MSEMFVSYASADKDLFLGLQHRADIMKTFITEITQGVAGKLGKFPPQDLTFYDREALSPGELWQTSLVHELQTAQVFLPFYSRSYFKSENCGKEFGFFAQRLIDLGEACPRIFPILLYPVGQFQRHAPKNLIERLQNPKQFERFPLEYRLRGLLALNLNDNSYRETIHIYTEMLAEALDTQVFLPPNPNPPPAFGDAPDFFLKDSPLEIQARARPEARAKFYSLAATQDELRGLGVRRDISGYPTQLNSLEWKPCHPNESRTINEIITAAVRELDFVCELDTADEKLLQKLDHDVKSLRVVTLIVDPWTLLQSKSTPTLLQVQKVDDIDDLNLLILPTCNAKDPEAPSAMPTIEEAVARFFPKNLARMKPHHLLFSPQSSRELVDRIVRDVKTTFGRLVFSNKPSIPVPSDSPPASLDL